MVAGGVNDDVPDPKPAQQQVGYVRERRMSALTRKTQESPQEIDGVVCHQGLT